MNLVPQVIEGEDAVEKHQHAVGNFEIVGRVFPDLLQPAHDVVGAVADGSGGEGRQAFDGRGTMLLQELFDNVENLAGAMFELAAALDCDLSAARLQAQKRTDAKKGVAADFFSAFDRFQEEGVRLSLGHGEKGGYRGKQIG